MNQEVQLSPLRLASELGELGRRPALEPSYFSFSGKNLKNIKNRDKKKIIISESDVIKYLNIYHLLSLFFVMLPHQT